MRYIFLFLLTITFLQNSFAQSRLCGTDDMVRKSLSQHPELQIQRDELEAFTQQYSSSGDRAIKVVPIVFHVIHNYGPENISDAQIRDGINVVNRNYRKKNADTIDIIPAFQSIAADNEVELRLAQLDPNGNCTSGINRIVSNLTYTGGHVVKDLIHWEM